MKFSQKKKISFRFYFYLNEVTTLAISHYIFTTHDEDDGDDKTHDLVFVHKKRTVHTWSMMRTCAAWENGAILLMPLLAATDGSSTRNSLVCTMSIVTSTHAAYRHFYGVTNSKCRTSCNRTKVCWHRNEIDHFVADGFNFPLVILHIEWT